MSQRTDIRAALLRGERLVAPVNDIPPGATSSAEYYCLALSQTIGRITDIPIISEKAPGKNYNWYYVPESYLKLRR